MSLDPEETRGIMLFRSQKGKVARVINPDVPLIIGEHSLTIRVLARDLPAQETKALFNVTQDGAATLRPAI
jgi:hypothetical protein